MSMLSKKNPQGSFDSQWQAGPANEQNFMAMPGMSNPIAQPPEVGMQVVTTEPLFPDVPQNALVPMTIDTEAPNEPITTSHRVPIMINGSITREKPTKRERPTTKRRMYVHAAVTAVLVVVVIGALAAVIPVGTGQAKGNLGVLNPLISMFAPKSDSAPLIAAQAATATAVTQDGYDAGNATYADVASAPVTLSSSNDAANLDRFFYGQCTYWANMRYHELTGYWVPWLGNAYEWAYEAPAYGWHTSSEPNPNGPSITVLAPYTEGAGAYGHVAVVETGEASANNGVVTSNWNWNGYWATTTYVTFYAGSGVTFLWY